MEEKYYAPDKQGISLRDFFAGQALAGLTADSEVDMSFDERATWCYSMADAALAERDKNK